MTSIWPLAQRSLLLLVPGLLLAACGPAAPEKATLVGTVLYRERIALPEGALVKVYLEDVALADAPADILAEHIYEPEGGPPFPFMLNYDPGRITEQGRYALRARIEVDGELWFINTTHTPAFPDAGQGLQILVNKVGPN